MELFQARNLALELMKRHGLDGWGFTFDHAKRRFGSCRPVQKRITLSRTLTFLNDAEQVRVTILHEIAHALAPRAGHGAPWRARCRELGIEPRRCYHEGDVVAPPRAAARYLIGCKACGWWVDRHKMTRRRLLCRRCRGPVVLREKHTGAEFVTGR